MLGENTLIHVPYGRRGSAFQFRPNYPTQAAELRKREIIELRLIRHLNL
jgi:hypothetical protein